MGQTFQQWKKQLSDLGYTIEHRELVAADYGAPTTRKRFVMVARCDGRPIIWPEPTHAPRDSEAFKSGKLLPWCSAAEIIDWSIHGYSVFDSKQEIKEKYGVNSVRPLAKNTLRRVIRGVDKFTIKSGKPFIIPTGYGERKGQASRVRDINDPVGTIVSAGKFGLCEPTLSAANLIQYHTEQTENVRASGLNAPIVTIDTSNRHGLVSAQLVEYYGNGNPLSIQEPMHTVTAHDREALVSAHIQKFFGGVIGEDAREPLPTVTSVDHNALCVAHVVEFKGQDIGQSADKPLRTITASAGEFAECRAVLVEVDGCQNLGHWPQVRELLNKYCGYSMAEDEIILLVINGIAFFISDILLRMLTPRELYNAMGFPPDYIINRDYKGNAYSKSKQVARCGNAVCPPMAEAVVRVNLPELCGRKYENMQQLHDDIAI